MPTQITQRESDGRTYLHVDGEMMFDDATVIERIVCDLIEEDDEVVIDLADLDFLDSESASVLKHLANLNGVTIEGLEIFLQSAIDAAERHGS